ncbi:cyclic nucleotide-binding domain-containing protein [Desulfococcaceae bacterium HSG8]|nr:cyclic nucleotide-binding domain-containing protein [Desulfococcaceae bacterium HSG8]
MSNPDIVFKIIEEKNCPLYELEDEFDLSGTSLSLPLDKPACIILVGDIKEIITLCQTLDEARRDADIGKFDCSGCTGSVWMEYRKGSELSTGTIQKSDYEISATANLLSNFSMFQALDERSIRQIVSSLKLKKFPKGTPIIKRGDPGVNLFILVSGKVEVLGDDGLSITFLEKGEVFGEMSLLSGDPVGATIKVVEDAKVLYINGRDFRKILNKFPSLQMYFARLLARRLAQTNIVRSEEFSSGMVGKLSEMQPTELFQTLNQNQKTGVLTLQLSRGSAEMTFREGGIIRAQYGKKEGMEAFFELLKQEHGRFKFVPGLPEEDMEAPEMGDFMWLLMEGLNKIDEERGGSDDA